MRTARYKKTYDTSEARDKVGVKKSSQSKTRRRRLEDGGGDVEEKFRSEWARREHRRETRRVKRIYQREKTKVCFKCRHPGHVVSECREMEVDVDQGTGICFICGSTEHSIQHCPDKHKDRDVEFPYAKCFICDETGHLSKNCPDNPRGLYPKGGCCNTCGSVEHFKRDCPEKLGKQKSHVLVLDTVGVGVSGDAEPDVLYDEEEEEDKPLPPPSTSKHKQKAKVVKF